MGPRLGELLVRSGVCSRPAVEEALKAQAIFGGRIGTNLLECGAISEERLAHALGERHGVPGLFGELVPEPSALALLRPIDADRLEVVPLRAAGKTLLLLTVDPGNVAALDEVAFATGHHLHPFVVPEARLWRLLNSAYGAFREERGVEGHQRPGPPPAPMPAPMALRPAAVAHHGEAPDLIDEAEFDALYGRVGVTTPGPFPSPLPPRVTPADVPPTEAPAHGLLPPEVAATPFWSDEEDASPLGFEAAVRLLAGVEERGAIARAVLRFARSRFQRALLLTVRRGQAHGWVGLGPGVTVDAVRRLRLPLGAEGVVATVVATRSHFLGPLPRTEANVRLLKGLGGGVPKSACLIPILALERVVNVLYVDAGRGELVDPSGLGELLILATRIAQGYDALVRRAV